MKNHLGKMIVVAGFVITMVSHAAIIVSPFPIENVILNPGDSVQANYSFLGHPLIFCWQDQTTDNNIGLVSWPFNGNLFTHALPTTLKNVTSPPEYDAFLADPIGVLTVTNNMPFVLTVSCEPAF